MPENIADFFYPMTYYNIYWKIKINNLEISIINEETELLIKKELKNFKINDIIYCYLIDPSNILNKQISRYISKENNINNNYHENLLKSCAEEYSED
jgi:hypothetical protein